jgi:hypothetical protein
MPSIKRAASAPGGLADCNLDKLPPAYADGACSKPFLQAKVHDLASTRSILLSSSEVARLPRLTGGSLGSRAGPLPLAGGTVRMACLKTTYTPEPNFSMTV